MPDDRRTQWIAENAVPLAMEGLPPRLILKRLLPMLPRGYEDAYLGPGMTRDIRDALRKIGLRPNVSESTVVADVGYKQLEAFTYDEIVALVAHRDEQIDADEAAKIREIEQWCAANPGHNVQEIMTAAKALRAAS